jgi:hypothetical protein
VYEFDERGNLAVYPPSEVSVQMFNDTTGPNFTPETDQETEYGIWPGVLDVPFQIVPGFSYAMWVWCDVFADGGLFGNGNGGAEVVCPFMVVEEAQV